jgi:GAF domain-containing protein
MSAPIQQNEARRLKVLWLYEVLDTVPEEVFDNLTELAACICEAPMALISLVDENRQWFKSRFGLTLTETSREISFCAHAIKKPGLFIVPNALKDPRFAENPLVVSEPKIRFYAGAPLVTTEGYALGTLCVIDRVPKELRPEQKQALTLLARHVVFQLELRKRSRDREQALKSEHHPEPESAKAKGELTRKSPRKKGSAKKPGKKKL